MITFKDEFIKRYVDKFAHKLTQDLQEKLPKKDFFTNMVDKANEILREIMKLNG